MLTSLQDCVCDPVHTDKNSSNGRQPANVPMPVDGWLTDNTTANSALGRHAFLAPCWGQATGAAALARAQGNNNCRAREPES